MTTARKTLSVDEVESALKQLNNQSLALLCLCRLFQPEAMTNDLLNYAFNTMEIPNALVGKGLLESYPTTKKVNLAEHVVNKLEPYLYDEGNHDLISEVQASILRAIEFIITELKKSKPHSVYVQYGESIAKMAETFKYLDKTILANLMLNLVVII